MSIEDIPPITYLYTFHRVIKEGAAAIDGSTPHEYHTNLVYEQCTILNTMHEIRRFQRYHDEKIVHYTNKLTLFCGRKSKSQSSAIRRQLEQKISFHKCEFDTFEQMILRLCVRMQHLNTIEKDLGPAITEYYQQKEQFRQSLILTEIPINSDTSSNILPNNMNIVKSITEDEKSAENSREICEIIEKSVENTAEIHEMSQKSVENTPESREIVESQPYIIPSFEEQETAWQKMDWRTIDWSTVE